MKHKGDYYLKSVSIQTSDDIIGECFDTSVSFGSFYRPTNVHFSNKSYVKSTFNTRSSTTTTMVKIVFKGQTKVKHSKSFYKKTMTYIVLHALLC